MNYKLHKLKDEFIITSDKITREEANVISHYQNFNSEFYKIIAQQDQIDFSSLSEEEHKKIGWFDDIQFIKNELNFEDKIFEKWINDLSKSRYVDLGNILNLLERQRELLSDRKFTSEDLFKFVEFYSSVNMRDYGYYQQPTMDGSHKEHNKAIDNKMLDAFIQSLENNSWNIELEMETVGKCDCICHQKDMDIVHSQPCCYPIIKPKITNGKVKITKIL